MMQPLVCMAVMAVGGVAGVFVGGSIFGPLGAFLGQAAGAAVAFAGAVAWDGA